MSPGWSLHKFAMLGVLLAVIASPETARAQTNVELIIDDSGSMAQRIEGQSKIAIAKKILSGFILDLPPDAQIAVRTYGRVHPSHERDCNDMELMTPFGPNAAARLLPGVEALKPNGMTPIAASLEAAVKDFAGKEGQKNIIVLLSDGEEDCNRDPCAAAKAVHEAGIQLEVNVIGFHVHPKERTQLRCIANAGGGKYFDAENAGELKVAANKMKTRVEATPAPQPPEAAARDRQRKKDLQTIYEALKKFNQDKGYLPTTESYGESNPGGWDYSSQGDFLPFLVSNQYLQAVPKDPINNGTGDVFYAGSGYSYAYFCYPNSWPNDQRNSLSLGAKLESGELYWVVANEKPYRCELLRTAGGEGRDLQRKKDLQTIYEALKKFNQDKGYLPTTESYGESNGGGWDYSSQGDFLPFLVSDHYLRAVPKDPINNGDGDVIYNGSGYSYAYFCYPNSWPNDQKNSLSLGAKLETGEVYWLVRNEKTYTCK